MTVELLHADCVDAVQAMEDDFIDLTVTSPPYDCLRHYTNEGEWNFKKFEQLAKELFRVTKAGGVVMWNVADQTIKGSETASSFKQALFLMECGFNLVDTMIYQKANPGGARGSNKTYTQAFEYMFVLSKGPLKTFNLICDRPNKWAGEAKAGGGRTTDGRVRPTRTIVTKAFGKRSNIWTYPTQQDEWSKQHPAAMPLAMAEDHIKSWTNAGDMVFDPFCGSGTTGLAAAKLGRDFVGSDVSEEYLNIAEQRLAEFKPVMTGLVSFACEIAKFNDWDDWRDTDFWTMSEDEAKQQLGLI